MTYEGLTTTQYKKVVELASKTNKTTDELVEEIIQWCVVYDNVDEILKDYEEVNC